VKAFYFQGYLFENLPKPETKNHPDAGYYEVLQSGTIQLYAKRKKLLNETVTSTGIVKKFTGSTSYYAFKGGNAYQIRNENSLLDLMPEKKNDAKNYLKQHSISYKSNPEQTLSTIAQFYNQPAH
ncbi:MAG: hypothetical protein H0U44_11745, partial [Flavisolibacter sp.]|nr:hypothetical protein [Flavisolibacter sp.]